MIDMLQMDEKLKRFWAKRPDQGQRAGSSKARKFNPERVRLVRKMIADGHSVEDVQDELVDLYDVVVSKQAIYDVVFRRSYADVV